LATAYHEAQKGQAGEQQRPLDKPHADDYESGGMS